MERIPERKIKWHRKSRKISQIPKEGLEYAFVSKNYEQVHQLVWCKDFMQDTIFGCINNRRTAIYGFCYDPETSPPLYMHKTKLMITNWKDRNLEQKVKENLLDFLHGIEDRLKMPKTKIEKCVGTPPIYKKSGVWILNGSQRWMKSPPMISMYTLFIRVGLIHQIGDSSLATINKVISGKIQPYYQTKTTSNDCSQLFNSKKAIRRILKYGDQKIFTGKIHSHYPNNKTVHVIHEHCGISGYSQGNTKPHFPQWHRLEKKQ